MSVTFYVDGWHEQDYDMVKIFAHDLYPDIDESIFKDDIYFSKDENGDYYEMKKVYKNPFPEVYFTSSHFHSLSSILKINFSSEGSFSHEKLSFLFQKIMFFINSNNIQKHEEKKIIDGNFIYGGFSSDQIKSKLDQLLILIRFAQQNKKSIYWA